jgi:hypothetical protein
MPRKYDRDYLVVPKNVPDPPHDFMVSMRSPGFARGVQRELIRTLPKPTDLP